MSTWREIPITEIPNFRIGHAEDIENATGCSVIVCEKKAVCSVDVRGGGPASRETELLHPTASNDGIHALLLGGGSAYGLDAAGGVMKYLEERGIGFRVNQSVVPIVAASCIFDLDCVGGNVRPDSAMGYEACLDSERNLCRHGNVGAGMGATVGKLHGGGHSMKSGLGTFAVQVGELQVGAIVAVNAIGDVFELDSQKQLAGLLNDEKTGMLNSEAAAVEIFQSANPFVANTTIGAVLTNADLSKAEAKKTAQLASNGIARTIRPVNTSMDGDSIYALSCGAVRASSDVVGTLGAYVLGKAVNRAVLEAEEIYGYLSAKSFLL